MWGKGEMQVVVGVLGGVDVSYQRVLRASCRSLTLFCDYLLLYFNEVSLSFFLLISKNAESLFLLPVLLKSSILAGPPIINCDCSWGGINSSPCVSYMVLSFP